MTFARYLTYRIKNSAIRTILFSLISMAIVFYGVWKENKSPQDRDNSGIVMLAVVMGIFATLIPILETACFKNRRNLDTLYCLPLKRIKLALAHYLSGFIQVFIIYSSCFFTTYIYLSILETQKHSYNLGWMLLYYFVSIVFGLVLYSIFIFLLSEANTVLDGVIISFLWVFAAALIMAVAYDYFSDLNGINLIQRGDFISSWGIIYAPINNITNIFIDLIEELSYTASRDYHTFIRYYVAWVFVGIAAAVGYFYNIVRKGAENAEEITDSWFGYKVLIPIYGFSFIKMNGDIDILTIIIIASMIIGYMVYRKSFKLKIWDYITVAACIFVWLFLGDIL